MAGHGQDFVAGYLDADARRLRSDIDRASARLNTFPPASSSAFGSGPRDIQASVVHTLEQRLHRLQQVQGWLRDDPVLQQMLETSIATRIRGAAEREAMAAQARRVLRLQVVCAVLTALTALTALAAGWILVFAR
jgi:hypothetical protein